MNSLFSFLPFGTGAHANLFEEHFAFGHIVVFPVLLLYMCFACFISWHIFCEVLIIYCIFTVQWDYINSQWLLCEDLMANNNSSKH